MKNIVLLFFLYVFVLFGCASQKVKDTRRTDFITGCTVGAITMSYSLHADIAANKIVIGCEQIYDTKEEEIKKELDKIYEGYKKKNSLDLILFVPKKNKVKYRYKDTRPLPDFRI